MQISGRSRVCMIIGDPVEHSLSPAMHNAGYVAAGLGAEFVYVAARVKIEEIGHVVSSMRTLGVRGVTCTMPHKVAIIEHLRPEAVDPVAREVGAVNTLVNDGEAIRGYNTDWLGVLAPLERVTALAGKRVAILGAGGAARSMAYAVASRGATFTVYNRTLARAEAVASDFGGDARPLDALEEVRGADVVLNATSIGMTPRTERTPLRYEFLSSSQVVFDSVYAPCQTRLLREAEAIGAHVIPGIEMLLYQGLAQFELYTGRPAPEDAMRAALMSRIA